MKKILMVILVVFLSFVLGFICGSQSVLFNAPKWVEEVHGQYMIVTDFMGNEYVDMADKPSHNYSYFSYVIERRP